jgi:hypothetical protein
MIIPLTSSFKDSLTTLLNDHYGSSVEYTETWSDPSAQESSDPTNQKLTVVMTFPGQGQPVTYFAVVPDQTQGSIDTAYSRFLGSMTNSLNAGRNPFGF